MTAKPKPDPGILELEGIYDKVTENFYRIKIQSGKGKGQVYISKALGIPREIKIIINIIPRKEEG